MLLKRSLVLNSTLHFPIIEDVRIQLVVSVFGPPIKMRDIKH